MDIVQHIRFPEPWCVCGAPMGKCHLDRDPKTCKHKRLVYAICDPGESVQSCHACGWSAPLDERVTKYCGR